jgi:hypothetical protein
MSELFDTPSQRPRGLRRGSSAIRLLELRVRIPEGAWMMSRKIFVCFQVEFFALGWSPAQRSPTESGVSECDHESSTMRRPWLTRGCRATRGKIFDTLQLVQPKKKRVTIPTHTIFKPLRLISFEYFNVRLPLDLEHYGNPRFYCFPYLHVNTKWQVSYDV